MSERVEDRGLRPASGNGRGLGRFVGAIDVGTNSIRLVVAEIDLDGGYRVIDDEKILTRLGRGLSASGGLSREAMEASAEAIANMRGIAEGYGVAVLRAIATCAVREAENREAFLELVRERAGVELEVASAEEEGRLAFCSVAHEFDLRTHPSAVVDIGGGSTEVVLATNGVIEQVVSLPLGAVRLTEMFGGCDGEGERGLKKMSKHIREVLREGLGKPEVPPAAVYGTGGTFTTMASVAMHRAAGVKTSDLLPFPTRGYEMERASVLHMLQWLAEMPVRARAGQAGLSPDRADIIVAGVAIVDEVLKRLNTNRLVVQDRGIRDGLILTLMREMGDEPGGVGGGGASRVQAARRFGVTCRYEERHAQHVAGLAVSLFDRLVELFPEGEGDGEDAAWRSAESRELLESAALLHDIGYLINYSKHHKHSYHLIAHSEMRGFSHRELDIVANVARYHRRSEPKSKHSGFAKLGERDRGVVRRLAAILRIADGLDRTHTQGVEGARVEREGDGSLVIVAEGVEEPGVDLWGAQRKSGMFEKEFGVGVRFEWSRTAGEEMPGLPEGRAGVPARGLGDNG